MVAANASLQLHAIAAALKLAGERDVRLGMTRGLRGAAAPLVPLVRHAALRDLPKAGGLNRYVAEQKITVSVRTGVNTAGVRLVTSTPATEQADQGAVRHPTFGRRGRGQWKVTKTRKGWWTDTLRAGSQSVTPALLRVMDEVAAKIRAA
jgi:hypothetical protein